MPEPELADLAFAEFTIDRGDERLLGPGGPVKLGNKAFRVLLLLAEQQGRLLTKDALFTSVWDGTIVSESALTSVIKELRHALGDNRREPRFIESVYGRGYRFIAPITAAPPPGRRSQTAAAPRETLSEGEPPLLQVAAVDSIDTSASALNLAAVVREEILFALSRFRDIRLVSDSTAAPATGDYGERDYQLSLKLVPSGTSFRVFARLCRLSTQAIIWADNIDLGNDSLGSDVDVLVRQIATAALPRMQDDLLCHLPAQPQDVYDHYFSAKLKMGVPMSLAEAREMAETWERMIREHPDFAPAYPLLIRLYNTDYCFSGLGSTGEAERRLAYDLAHRAVAIDPAESRFHTAKGWCHMWAGEWSIARDHLNEALRLNPYNKGRLVEVATALMYLDELDAAADLLEKCRDLTPFVTEAPHQELGLLHLLRDEFDTAAEHLLHVRRDNPDDRVGPRPTIIGEMYSVWAAAGMHAHDLKDRAACWRDTVAGRWCGAEPLTNERLKQWVLHFSPFQKDERLTWLLGLLERAYPSGDMILVETGREPEMRPDDAPRPHSRQARLRE